MEKGKEYVIALDLGKHDTKAIGRSKDSGQEDIMRIKFRTKMLELIDTDVEIGEKSNRLTYDGKEIIIGEQGVEDEDNYLTSKSSPLHKYSAYVGISKFLQPETTGNKIELALACPLPVVKNVKAKEAYKEMIKNSGEPVKILVDGKNYEFEISDIVVKSEDSCTIYMDKLNEEEELGIIGFGGLNMNFLLYKNGEFVYKKAWEHGSIKLIQYIRDDLTFYKNGNIVDELTASKALIDGYITYKGKKDEGSAEVVENTLKRFLNDAKKLILQDGHDIDSLKKLAFVGGTTTQLNECVKSQYPHAVTFNDPQWTAVEGLYKVAVARYIK